MNGPTQAGGGAKADRHAMVPTAELRTYYDRPILKEPVWTVEVPWYFFAGGLSGASAVLATAARLAGNAELARAARRAALVGALVSPPLLVADLGRPERFANMLRVFKPTSPMSLGSWALGVFVPAALAAGVLGETTGLPGLQRVAEVTAAAFGPLIVTYTAALVADTAIPVWHEGRAELPLVFVGGAAASAGAAAVLLTPAGRAGPARSLTAAGAVVAIAAMEAMKHRLGPLARPYREGAAGRSARAATGLMAVGATTVGLLGRRHHGPAVAGAAMVLAGAVSERFAVFRAGRQSARDPRATVGHQRARAGTTGPAETVAVLPASS